MVALTVLFATHNGADTLPRMLDAIEGLDVPTGGFKIVVVENGSTDNGAALIRSRSGKMPITLLTLLAPGKNAALNKGLSEIEGDLVVLTDDDVIPRHDWLVSIQRIAQEQPGYDIFGGAIYPVWEEAPPEWVFRNVPKEWFGWTDFHEGPVEPQCVWGGNMTVRSQVFRNHRFFEAIGPNGTQRYAVGSETEFTGRMAKAGHLCWHSRNSVVGHIVPAYRLKSEWLLQRAYNQARGDRRLMKLHEGQDTADGLSPDVMRKLFYATLDLMQARLFGSPERQFKAKLRLRMLQGDLTERRSCR